MLLGKAQGALGALSRPGTVGLRNGTVDAFATYREEVLQRHLHAALVIAIYRIAGRMVYMVGDADDGEAAFEKSESERVGPFSADEDGSIGHTALDIGRLRLPVWKVGRVKHHIIVVTW